MRSARIGPYLAYWIFRENQDCTAVGKCNHSKKLSFKIGRDDLYHLTLFVRVRVRVKMQVLQYGGNHRQNVFCFAVFAARQGGVPKVKY